MDVDEPGAPAFQQAAGGFADLFRLALEDQPTCPSRSCCIPSVYCHRNDDPAFCRACLVLASRKLRWRRNLAGEPQRASVPCRDDSQCMIEAGQFGKGPDTR